MGPGSAKVTLGSVTFFAISSVGWALTSGTRPTQTYVDIPEMFIPQIEPLLGQPQTLRIEAPGHGTIQFEKIYPIDIRAGDAPRFVKVRLLDLRWLWSRTCVLRSYNMVRRTGTRRVVSFTRIENIESRSDLTYAPWSLDKDGKPWTALTLLNSIFDDAGISFENRLDNARYGGMIPQNVEITAPLEYAISIALQHFPGVNIFVDRTGKVILYDMRKRGEVAVVDRAGPPLSGTGSIRPMNRSHLRPSGIDVFFSREIEMRLDYIEHDYRSTTVDRNELRDLPILENVMPQPDPFLTYTDGVRRTAGTWVPVIDYLLALEASGLHMDTVAGAGGRGAITISKIRTYFLGRWNELERDYTRTTAGAEQDSLWVQRLSTIRGCYRRFYRFTPKWRDRILSVKNYLVSVVDIETGSRAPAAVFMDYVTKPSQFAVSQATGDRSMHNLDVGRQVMGWAPQLKDGTIAPVDVTVRDVDGGILSFEFKPDPWGEAEAHAPGRVKRVPVMRVGERLTADQLGEANVAWSLEPLLPDFKLAFLVTIIVGAPNNESRFHKESVSVGEGQEISGAQFGECKGPPLSLIIPDQMQTARFAWLDESELEILEAVWGASAGAKIPSRLMVNQDHIQNIARSAAAAEWMSYMDRLDGSAGFLLMPDAEIDGVIESISHEVRPNGVALTQITMQNEHLTLPKEAFLPPGTQSLIRRLVQP